MKSFIQFINENTDEHKQKQLEIIKKENPAPNKYNTWIRELKDIKTADEVFNEKDDGYEMYPDFTPDDMKKALSKGKIKVYSSYKIKNGIFVSPSYMCAKDYCGDKEPYSKTVKLSDVAWIDGSEGIYAKI